MLSSNLRVYCLFVGFHLGDRSKRLQKLKNSREALQLSLESSAHNCVHLPDNVWDSHNHSHVIWHTTSSFVLISDYHYFCASYGPMNHWIFFKFDCYRLQTQNWWNCMVGLELWSYLHSLNLFPAVKTLYLWDFSHRSLHNLLHGVFKLFSYSLLIHCLELAVANLSWGVVPVHACFNENSFSDSFCITQQQ